MIRAPRPTADGDLHHLLLRDRQLADAGACTSTSTPISASIAAARALHRRPVRPTRGRAADAPRHRFSATSGCRRTRAPGAPCRRRPAARRAGEPKCTGCPSSEHASRRQAHECRRESFRACSCRHRSRRRARGTSRPRSPASPRSAPARRGSACETARSGLPQSHAAAQGLRYALGTSVNPQALSCLRPVAEVLLAHAHQLHRDRSSARPS